MPSNSKKPEELHETGEFIDILVGPRRSHAAKQSGVHPLSAFAMDSAVKSIKNNFSYDPIKVIRSKIIKTKSTMDEATDVFKYRMNIQDAAILAQTAGHSVVVEVDSHLQYGAFAPSSLMQQLMGRTNYSNTGIKEANVKIRIVGADNTPLAGVSVTMEAAGFPQEGVTNARGELVLKLFELPGGNLVKSVFVRPSRGHWNRILNAPNLTTTGINVIRLKSIADTLPNFPQDARYGWGHKMMGLDVLPDAFTGKGVKIAIIDSGADSTHPSLKHIKTGFDMTNDQNATSWKNDVIGHGSHCAGVITGKTEGEEAIRGFAPDAEIIVMKVFPGGQFSSLLDALAKCIELDVDVVNMSLGGGDASEVVEQQIEECVQHGIACIVAAGNSGGPVQYPAKSPSVLAVSAIGQIDQVPSDTWEASTMQPETSLPGGIFSPSFTCHGPEIGVTGPGVGIISSVPDGAFDPQSGTSMATPHICGMAALIIAHHPDFRSLPRDGNRVAHLFAMLRGNAQSLALSPDLVGAGMPTLHHLMSRFVGEDHLDETAASFAMASANPTARPVPSHQPIMPGAQPGFYYNQAQPGYIVTPQGVFYR